MPHRWCLAIAPGSTAERAGLSVGDTILEINGQRVNDSIARHLAALLPGQTLHLRVRNSAGERELHWTLDARQEIELQLTDLDKVTPAQKARRTAWLKGEAQAGETRP